jgi:hypothetical protein
MSDGATASGYQDHLRETVKIAEGVLAGAFSRPARLDIQHDFRGPGYRATVLRCRLLDVDENLPQSVIVKRFRGQEGEPYDLADTDPRGARARFLNEWTGARFLQTMKGERPFGPAVYGADSAAGLVLLEDLGEGECLADHLQGDDPVQAERALLAYAATLGRMHAATAGRDEEHAALHQELARGGSNPAGSRMVASWVASGLTGFRDACSAIELAISDAALAELATLPPFVDDPGPFSAYSVGDTCPDNHRYAPGDPGSVRFYDMEFGGFQHALLDAAYLWMPFPTCWCVARFPVDLPPRLEAAYRAELVRGCPDAADDGMFERAMAQACAVWFVLTVAWSLTHVLERDDTWGISSHRQRLPLRAENFARVARRASRLPALAELAEQLSERLRARWGEAVAMPLYPPFRASP